MTAVLRVESRRHVRGSLVLLIVFAVLTVFMLAVFPAMADQAELMEEAFPDHVLGLMGFEDMHTLEGFGGSYVYEFIWVLFFGMYFAYLGGGMVAADIRKRRMDLVLSNPVSRESVLLQKFGGLWVPLVILNVGLFAVMQGGSVLLGETLDPVWLAMTHLLLVPYLLFCGAIGLLCSVILEKVESAQGAAIGAVLILWLVDGLSLMDPDLEWIGEFTPSRHVDPVTVLLDETIPLVDIGILLLVLGGVLAVTTVIFVRRDI